jgi:hypothetical protein
MKIALLPNRMAGFNLMQMGRVREIDGGNDSVGSRMIGIEDLELEKLSLLNGRCVVISNWES